MTTPTKLREAAERLHAMSYQKTMQEHDDLHLAANTLRAIADAQSELDERVNHDPVMRGVYEIGYAAGLAAQPLYALDPQTGSVSLVAQEAKVKELEAQRDMYRDACQAYYDKQIAHNHKMENLPQIEKPKDIRDGLLLLADWFDALYDEKGKDVEVQRDLRKWADDVPALEAALATAKADALTLAGEVTDKSETINTLNRRIDYVRRNWKDVDSWWREDMDNALRESLPSENSPGPSTGAPVGFAGRIEGKGRY